VLMLVPPHWHRLRSRDLMVEFECVSALNFSLAHCDVPVVSRLVVHNPGSQPSDHKKLRITVPGYGHTDELTIPSLSPSETLSLPEPKFHFAHYALEHHVEGTKRAVAVKLNGHALQGETIECSVLPHNEWSEELAHRICLGAFVLPNHPLVAPLALEASQHATADAKPEEILAAVHDHLFGKWNLQYLVEPPSYEWSSQKVRFPHLVLLDCLHHKGQGTCIDLALLIAACLEYLSQMPLIAIINMGTWGHALVGCWQEQPWTVEPVVVDKARLLKDAVIHQR
jgi:hypothetical protein